MWKLKNGTINYDLKCLITCKAQSCTGDIRRSDLYLTEKQIPS